MVVYPEATTGSSSCLTASHRVRYSYGPTQQVALCSLRRCVIVCVCARVGCVGLECVRGWGVWA